MEKKLEDGEVLTWLYVAANVMIYQDLPVYMFQIKIEKVFMQPNNTILFLLLFDAVSNITQTMTDFGLF